VENVNAVLGVGRVLGFVRAMVNEMLDEGGLVSGT